MAVHNDRDAAVASGLAEFVERFSTASLWHRPARARIDLETAPPYARHVIRASGALGYEALAVVDEIVSGVPVAIALLRRLPEAGNGPFLVAGTAAASSWASALTRAFDEAWAQLIHAIEIWPNLPACDSDTPYGRFLHYLDRSHGECLLNAWGIDTAIVAAMPVGRRCMPSSPWHEMPFDVLVADRGNVATDSLGLAAVQVVVPALVAVGHEGPGGLPRPTP
jgi:hypothetical protein